MAKERMALKDLVPLPWNPRAITEEELGRLENSIKGHTGDLADWDSGQGFRLVTTITVNKQGSRIVGGHQRVVALQRLGQDWIHRDDITWVDLKPNSAEEKALNIALNSEDASGSWNYEMLSSALEDIAADNVEIDLTGLAPATFEPLMAADWQPPPVSDGDFGGTDSHFKTVAFTEEQWQVVVKAIEAVREAKGEDLSYGKSLVVVCESYQKRSKQ